MTGNLFLEMLYYFKKNEMRWQVSTSALTILLSGIEQDLLSKQGGFFSEFYYVCAGWNFSFITWKFANSVENCSEIVKQACSFKRYLRVLNTKVAKNIELMRMLSDWHLREMEYLRRNWAQTLIDVRLDLCCSSLRGLSFKKLLEGKLCSDFDRCSDFFF